MRAVSGGLKGVWHGRRLPGENKAKPVRDSPRYEEHSFGKYNAYSPFINTSAVGSPCSKKGGVSVYLVN